MPTQLKFKISSALKDIIGRDLITDDFVAIFELVKNSYDAYASKVDVIFEKLNTRNAKIIIKDDGKGMNYDDLKNRWLFVAYSAKKEGTEDRNYRDRIYQNRPFAGAKGIGRFSCDRLGKKLKLETTKKEKPAKTHVLVTDWEKFEENLRDEFIDIQVTYTSKDKSDFGLKHGTVLEVLDPRSEWDRNKLLKLKDSLAKLINPSRGLEEKNFKINLIVNDELEQDGKETEYYNKVNGEIQNFIFETLELKTTQISSKLSDDGKEIVTELKDGGTLIYRLKERNTYKLLHDIECNLFYLNQSAKLTFARRMGIATVNYGSVSMYKNGFRIYPFGEPGEDSLGLDKRKGQGYSRFLGTRDLIGRIEINGANEELRETSSRGDGLIKTKTYYSLIDCFYEKVLKRLERYVVDVQEWGLSIESDFNSTEKDVFLKSVTENLIKVTSENDILDIEYNDDILNIIQNVQNDSAIAVAKNLKKIAIESSNDRLLELALSVEKKIQSFKSAIADSDFRIEEEKVKVKSYEKELEEVTSENLFLKSLKSEDFREVVSLLHHVGIYAGTIENYLTGLYRKVSSNQPIEKNEIVEIVRIVSFELKKILNISAFATKANFKLKTESLETNVDDYVKEYVKNVLPSVISKSTKIFFYNANPTPFITEIKPIELNIVIDNLIDNAKKAGAKNIEVLLRRNNEYKFEIVVKDDGAGIVKENLKRIFDFGFTTTKGSGLGLYHVNQIIGRINGKITAHSIEGNGSTFVITLN